MNQPTGYGTNIYLSATTRKQVEELMARLGLGISQVIKRAIEELHRGVMK